MAPSRGHFHVWTQTLSSALVLLDESGDLGWVLDQPYRMGGSSRYFTIAAAIGTQNTHRKFGKVIDKVHKTQGWTSAKEKKWIKLAPQARRVFAEHVVDLCDKEHRIALLVSVIEKKLVPPHLHDHFHLLYSWMASSLIAANARVYDQLSICPDELNAGSGSQTLIENILRKELWFNLRASTVVKRVPRTEALDTGLMFCDFLAGAVQSHFEDGISEAYDKIKKYIFVHRPWC